MKTIYTSIFNFLSLLLVVLILFGIKTPAYSHNTTKAEKEQIETLILAYQKHLSALAKSSDDEAREHLAALCSLMEDKEMDHAFDLFKEETDETAYSYFEAVIGYHNDIEIKFEKPNVLDCAQENDSKIFGLAIVNKTLIYKGESEPKEVKLLFGVNMSHTPFKITRVEYAKTYTENGGSCSVDPHLNDNKKEHDKYQAAANKEFINENYPQAYLLYKQSTVYTSNNDQYVASQMATCDNHIRENQKTYYDQAESYSQNGQYGSAKPIYRNLIRLYPDRAEILNPKIKECNSNMSRSNAGLGNTNYNNGSNSAGQSKQVTPSTSPSSRTQQPNSQASPTNSGLRQSNDNPNNNRKIMPIPVQKPTTQSPQSVNERPIQQSGSANQQLKSQIQTVSPSQPAVQKPSAPTNQTQPARSAPPPPVRQAQPTRTAPVYQSQPARSSGRK